MTEKAGRRPNAATPPDSPRHHGGASAPAQAEAALQREREFTRTLLDNLAEGVVACDATGTLVLFNQAACDWHGMNALALPPDQWSGHYDLFGADGITPLATESVPLVRAFRGETVRDAEMSIVAKGQPPRHVLASGGPFYDARHTLLGAVIVMRDVTDRKRADAALRESEEKFRYVFTRSPIGKSFTLPSGEVQVNQAFGNLLGYSHEELNGKRWEALSHPDDVEMTQRHVDRLLAGRAETARFTTRYLRKDGAVVWADVSTALRRDRAGVPLYFITAINDITDRVKAEEALRLSEERHRTIIETAMDGFWIVDRQARLLEVNETYSRMSGYTRQELLTKRVSDLDVNESISDTAAHVRRLIELGENRFESRHRRKDGTPFDVEVSVQYRPDGDGCLVCFVRDITARKLAEQKLAYIMAAVESTQEAVGISDAHGRHVYQNKALTDLFGYASADELEAAGGGPAVVKDPAVARAMFDNITHGRSWVGELEMVTKSGRVFPAFERADAILDKDGQVAGLIGIIADITERKRQEEERARLETQLRTAQKMESVGRLAGGVAHDFNNMLGVILGNAELALGQLDATHPLHDGLREIQQAAVRSADLTRQLLAFARKQPIAPRIVDLNATVEGMLKMLRRMIGEDIDLVWQPKADLGPVRLDPSQIDQILANLCVNARDAIAGVGKVTIETGDVAFTEEYCADHPGFVPGSYVLLAVSDDGCGIAEDVLPHIFEPFFTTKAMGMGTGLGLATVYGIVKQNSGFINVYSEPNHGTSFKVYLPCHVDRAAQERTELPAAPAPRGHETILLVEDEAAILKLTVTALERQGYAVIPAATPGEAIRLAESRTAPVDLLMTDVVMPEMNGRTLAKHLLARYPRLKCLFMSGYTANVIFHRGVLDDGVHFIQKPFSIEGLSTKVREALDAEE